MGQNNDKARAKQYREYLNAELEAAAIYGALADTEENDDRAQVFRDLVSAEMRHARRWAEKLGIDIRELVKTRLAEGPMNHTASSLTTVTYTSLSDLK